MSLEHLNNRLKDIVSFDAEKLIYKYIKDEIFGVVLEANRDQLFNKSEDIYGIPLGFYTSKGSKKSKGFGVDVDRIGKPFKMIDSGELKHDMFIKVHYRNITIGSTSIHAKFFSYKFDKELFGLQPKNINKIIRRWIIPMLKERLTP